jgi:preprotein translocase subunit SecD
MMQRRPPKRKERIVVNKWVLLLIFGLLLVSIWLLSPSGSSSLHRKNENMGLRLGLDLKGGTYIVYQAEFPETTENKDEAFNSTVDLIRRRIDEYGVFEPVIQKQEGYRIAVQLPGVTDVEKAQEYIFKPGWLEFRQVEMNGSSTVSLDDYLSNTGRTSFFDTSDATLQDANRIFGDANGQPIVFLEKSNEGLKYVDQNGNPVDAGQLDKTALSWMPAVGTVGSDVKALNGNQYLTDASLHDIRDQLGNISGYEVGIKWNKEGADLFGQITKSLRNRGDYGTPQRALGIFLDNVLISSPQVYPSDMTGEYGDTASITGNFTQSEAKLLAIELRFDALPMPLHVLSASPG